MESKAYEFPIICQIARDYLAIPATSAPSERTFSYAGNLISKRRTRISSENVRYVLCLRSWNLIAKEEDEIDILFDENGEIIGRFEALDPTVLPTPSVGALIDPFLDPLFV